MILKSIDRDGLHPFSCLNTHYPSNITQNSFGTLRRYEIVFFVYFIFFIIIYFQTTYNHLFGPTRLHQRPPHSTFGEDLWRSSHWVTFAVAVGGLETEEVFHAFLHSFYHLIHASPTNFLQWQFSAHWKGFVEIEIKIKLCFNCTHPQQIPSNSSMITLKFWRFEAERWQPMQYETIPPWHQPLKVKEDHELNNEGC